MDFHPVLDLTGDSHRGHLYRNIEKGIPVDIRLYRPTLINIHYAQVYSRLEHEPIDQSIIVRVGDGINIIELAFRSRDDLTKFISSLPVALEKADEKAKSI